MTGGGRQHYRLTICIELVELTNSVSVSDDKIPITILILRRGALSTPLPNIPKEATSSTVCALIELDQADSEVEGGGQEDLSICQFSIF